MLYRAKFKQYLNVFLCFYRQDNGCEVEVSNWHATSVLKASSFVLACKRASVPCACVHLSPWNPVEGHIFIVLPVKAFVKGQEHYLNGLGQEDCLPLQLSVSLRTVLRCYLIKASCLLQRFFQFALSSRLQRNYLLKKSINTLRFCGKWSNFFRRPWHYLQMQAETSWTLKSSFVRAMLIEWSHRTWLDWFRFS